MPLVRTALLRPRTGATRVAPEEIRRSIPAGLWFNPPVPAENTEQRKFATIMFTDMVRSSALAQRREIWGWARLVKPRHLACEGLPMVGGTCTIP